MKYDLSSLIAFTIFSAFIIFVSFGPFTLAIASMDVVMWLYFILAIKAMKGIKIFGEVYPTRVFTDERVECKAYIENRSRFTLSHVEINDFAAEGYTFDGEKHTEGMLHPKERMKVEYAMGFRTRGVHEFHGIKVTLKSALGLFSIDKTSNPPRSTLVFPKILPIERFRTMLVDPTEGDKTDFRILEDASHIVGVHEYSGEPFQRIHWKISAHLDNLMVKEYEYTASSIVRMYVDYNLPKEVYARKVWSSIRKGYEEYASMAASGIVKHLSERGMQITLKVLANKVYEVSPQMARHDYIPYLDAIARAKGTDDPGEDVSLENHLLRDMYTVSRNTTVIVLSLYLTEGVVPKLLTVRSRVARVIAFVMPYGFRMPYDKKYRTFAILPQEVKKLRDQSALLLKNGVLVHVMMDNESVDEVIKSYERNPLENL